MVTLFWLKAS